MFPLLLSDADCLIGSSLCWCSDGTSLLPSQLLDHLLSILLLLYEWSLLKLLRRALNLLFGGLPVITVSSYMIYSLSIVSVGFVPSFIFWFWPPVIPPIIVLLLITF